MKEAETVAKSPFVLSPEDIRRVDAYWRAANYLSVG
jgi:phosphoketolase